MRARAGAVGRLDAESLKSIGKRRKKKNNKKNNHPKKTHDDAKAENSPKRSGNFRKLPSEPT
jgi:hypothetical protein